MANYFVPTVFLYRGLQPSEWFCAKHSRHILSENFDLQNWKHQQDLFILSRNFVYVWVNFAVYVVNLSTSE